MRAATFSNIEKVSIGLEAKLMRLDMQMLCCLSLLVATEGGVHTGVGRQQKPECQVEITYDLAHYESRGAQIQVERYQPKKDGVFPVIIFIHGAAGIFARSGSAAIPETDNFGEKRAACSSYVVLVPHYLDSSDQAAVLDPAETSRKWPLWLDAVEDAVSYATRVSKADAGRIGLYGESLGGYLAIAVASRDRRVGAISEFAGGIPPSVDLQNVPPVLIQHGEEDQVVAVSEAHKIGSELKKLGLPFLLKTYRCVGHYPDRNVQSKLAEETVRFFRRYLEQFQPRRLPRQ